MLPTTLFLDILTIISLSRPLGTDVECVRCRELKNRARSDRSDWKDSRSQLKVCCSAPEGAAHDRRECGVNQCRRDRTVPAEFRDMVWSSVRPPLQMQEMSG